MTYLQWQPANGEYQDDDGDQFDDPLLSLHGLNAHSRPTKRLLKSEIGYGAAAAHKYDIIILCSAIYQNLENSKI